MPKYRRPPPVRCPADGIALVGTTRRGVHELICPSCGTIEPVRTGAHATPVVVADRETVDLALADARAACEAGRQRLHNRFNDQEDLDEAV